MINALQELRQYQDAVAEREQRRTLADLAQRKFAAEQQMQPGELEGQRLSNLGKVAQMQMAQQQQVRQQAQDVAAADFQRQRLGVQRDAIKARADALANRPKPSAPVIQTEDGIYERGADGSLKQLLDPTTGKPLKPKGGVEKPLTEFQGKSAGYGSRAQASHDIITDLEGKYSPAAVNAKMSLQDLPGIGGAAGLVGNLALSKEGQRAEQAQRDFVNAVLRQESGAAISMGEFDNAKKQYFPQPGDSKAVIDQKRQNRERAISGFEMSAGKQGGEPIRRLREESAARRGEQGQSGQNSFNALPDPSQFDGKRMTDTATGIKYISKGGKWLKAE